MVFKKGKRRRRGKKRKIASPFLFWVMNTHWDGRCSPPGGSAQKRKKEKKERGAKFPPERRRMNRGVITYLSERRKKVSQSQTKEKESRPPCLKKRKWLPAMDLRLRIWIASSERRGGEKKGKRAEFPPKWGCWTWIIWGAGEGEKDCHADHGGRTRTRRRGEPSLPR